MAMPATPCDPCEYWEGGAKRAAALFTGALPAAAASAQRPHAVCVSDFGMAGTAVADLPPPPMSPSSPRPAAGCSSH